MVAEKDRILRKINQFQKNLQKKYDLKKLIIFGSVARGTFHKDSDIDLIVISSSFAGQKIFERSVPLYAMWDHCYAVDFLCYTPEEFKKKKNSAFLCSALKYSEELPLYKAKL